MENVGVVGVRAFEPLGSASVADSVLLAVVCCAAETGLGRFGRSIAGDGAAFCGVDSFAASAIDLLGVPFSFAGDLAFFSISRFAGIALFDGVIGFVGGDISAPPVAGASCFVSVGFVCDPVSSTPGTDLSTLELPSFSPPDKFLILLITVSIGGASASSSSGMDRRIATGECDLSPCASECSETAWMRVSRCFSQYTSIWPCC